MTKKRSAPHSSLIRVAALATAAAALGLASPPALAQHEREAEPNNTIAQATPITANPAKVTAAMIWPSGDVDVYSFQATAGQRVYAATATAFSYNASYDTQMALLGPDGVSVIEEDLSDGSHGSLAGCIAGAIIPEDGTYYLRIWHGNALLHLVSYDLYLRLQDPDPVAEVEPNPFNNPQPLPASGWVLGELSALDDEDHYSIALEAGDTLVVSLDLDPERDGVEWDGGVGIASIGGYLLLINDTHAGRPASETHHVTVKDGGEYYVRVAVPSGGTTFGTYGLSVAVIPAEPCAAGTANRYVTEDLPFEIGSASPGVYTSKITIPDNVRIGRLRVGLDLVHELMADLDVELRSPSGNTVVLFTDIGATTTDDPGLTQMDLIIDDDAALPITVYPVVRGMVVAPERLYRLDWFKGGYAGGEWTLTIHDDAAGNGGFLNSWFLEICEEPLSECPGDEVVIFATDFEDNDGGFTSAGLQNEWQHGTPTAAPLDTAFSGVKVWATDLTGTYNANCIQDLFSPQIDLTNAAPPIYLRWAQQHQMQEAIFDPVYVDVLSPSGAPQRRVFEWIGPTQATPVGNPSVQVQMAAGWAMKEVDISEYAGHVIQVRYKLMANALSEWGGLAIDDFSVVACGSGTPPCPADWDQSGTVNSSDISAFLTAWLASVTAPDLTADFNQDGTTNSSDISAFLTAWLDAVTNGC